MCKQEQAPTDDEEIALDWTKEALTFKWYEEPEDWDRLCPADEDADMDDMKTRYRELYSSLLRLDKLKKKTKTGFPVNRRRRSRTNKTCRALAEGVDSLWTKQGWSSARKNFRTLQEDTSSERGTDDLELDVSDVRPRQEPKTKSRKSQTEVWNSADIPLLCTTKATTERSHMTQPCGHKARCRRTCGCKCSKDPKSKVSTSRFATGLQ